MDPIRLAETLQGNDDVDVCEYVIDEMTMDAPDGRLAQFPGVGSGTTAALRALAIVTVMLRSKLARADQEFLDQRDPVDVEEEQAAVERGPSRWYGWQLLIADGLAAPVMFASASAISSSHRLALGGPLFYAAYGGWVIVGPLIHVTHRGWRSTAISAVIRLGASLFIGWVFKEQYSGADEDSWFTGGLMLSALPLSIIDAAALAYR